MARILTLGFGMRDDAYANVLEDDGHTVKGYDYVNGLKHISDTNDYKLVIVTDDMSRGIGNLYKQIGRLEAETNNPLEHPTRVIHAVRNTHGYEKTPVIALTVDIDPMKQALLRWNPNDRSVLVFDAFDNLPSNFSDFVRNLRLTR